MPAVARIARGGLAITVALAALAVASPGTPAGRWNLQVDGGDIHFPAWVEIAGTDEAPTVRYVGRVGSVRDIREFELRGDTLTFSRNEWFGAYEVLHHAFTISGDRVAGGLRRANGQTMVVTGAPTPPLARQAPARWSAPRRLFNGRDFTGWTITKGGELAKTWRVTDGEIVTFAGGGDVRTNDVFDDFTLHVEFNYPPDSNSGVYLRGRYELQIEDDSPKAPLTQQTGGLYGWLGPERAWPRQPGVWHALDITLVGRRISVRLDGQTLYADREIPGITGGAIDGDEAAPGPITLQASHSKTRGEVRFRNIMILTPDER